MGRGSREPADSGGEAENAPQIKLRAIAELIPYERNARTHSAGQVAQIAASIKEFGWTNPVLLDGNNGVIAGHGRLLAAQLLGLQSAPCIELAHLTEAQKRAYILADNQLAINAGWDVSMLSGELRELQEADFDLSLTGFEEGELALLLAGMDTESGAGAGSLAERFLVPPFSILDARQGYWQERKRAWLALGIRSEIGRGENALGFSDTVNMTQAGKNPRRHLAR